MITKTVLTLFLITIVFPGKYDLTQPISLLRFLEKVVENQKRNRLTEMKYSYKLIRQETKFDSKGTIKNRESVTYEVIPLIDRMYRKLIKKNGTTLSKSEARDQEKKLSVQLKKQKNLSSEALSKLKLKRIDRQRREIQFWDETLNSFHFLYMGEDIQDRRRVFIIKFWPNKGYQLTNKNFVILKKLQGLIWIDPIVSQIVRVKVDFVEDFKIGGGLLIKVSKGSSLVFEQEQIKSKIWFPTHFEFDFKGRFFFFKRFKMKVNGYFTDYANYREFDSSND